MSGKHKLMSSNPTYNAVCDAVNVTGRIRDNSNPTGNIASYSFTIFRFKLFSMCFLPARADLLL